MGIREETSVREQGFGKAFILEGEEKCPQASIELLATDSGSYVDKQITAVTGGAMGDMVSTDSTKKQGRRGVHLEAAQIGKILSRNQVLASGGGKGMCVIHRKPPSTGQKPGSYPAYPVNAMQSLEKKSIRAREGGLLPGRDPERANWSLVNAQEVNEGKEHPFSIRP